MLYGLLCYSDLGTIFAFDVMLLVVVFTNMDGQHPMSSLAFINLAALSCTCILEGNARAPTQAKLLRNIQTCHGRYSVPPATTACSGRRLQQQLVELVWQSCSQLSLDSFVSKIIGRLLRVCSCVGRCNPGLFISHEGEGINKPDYNLLSHLLLPVLIFLLKRRLPSDSYQQHGQGTSSAAAGDLPRVPSTITAARAHCRDTTCIKGKQIKRGFLCTRECTCNLFTGEKFYKSNLSTMK